MLHKIYPQCIWEFFFIPPQKNVDFFGLQHGFFEASPNIRSSSYHVCRSIWGHWTRFQCYFNCTITFLDSAARLKIFLYLKMSLKHHILWVLWGVVRENIPKIMIFDDFFKSVSSLIKSYPWYVKVFLRLPKGISGPRTYFSASSIKLETWTFPIKSHPKKRIWGDF